MELWLLCLWFYWTLIKQIVEAHNEAGDWCRWESSCLSRLCVFIGSASPPPHPSIKESPTWSGNGLEKGNELSARVPQSTGQGLPEQGLCPGFRRVLRGSEGRVQGQPGHLPLPGLSPERTCQCALLMPKPTCQGTGGQTLQEDGSWNAQSLGKDAKEPPNSSRGKSPCVCTCV